MIVSNQDRVLVVCAHSDDEALGCAGSLAKWSAEVDTIATIFLTNGVSSRSGDNEKEIKARYEAQRKCMNILNVNDYENYNFPDNALDTVPILELAKTIENKINKFKPTIILTHNISDLNIDHRKCCEAVLVATRPQNNNSVRFLASFEILSSTEWNFASHDKFSPNLFVDISKHLKTKIAACECYEAEIRKPPHSRSIENVLTLAKLRGSSVGVEYAESFKLLRGIF